MRQATNIKYQKDTSRRGNPERRIFILKIVFIIFAAAIAVKLFMIQVLDHNYYYSYYSLTLDFCGFL